MHGVPGEFSLWKCSCSLIFINPQPDEEEIAKYYPQDYKPYEESNSSFTDRLIEKLEKVYYDPNQSWLLKSLFFPLRPLVRGALVKPGARLLDVGCGAGSFLKKMEKYGMEVYGVDFSKVAVSRARTSGLNVFHGSLEKAKFSDEYFDVITLNHVFEHLHDPLKTLRELKRILKTKGTIIMGVPNANAIGYKIFGSNYVQIDSPRHLFLFSHKVLQAFAKKVDLKIFRKRFQSLPGFSLVTFDYWLNRFRQKKILGVNSWLFNKTLLKLCLFPFTTFLSWTPWADNIEVWLKKEDTP